MKGFRIPDAWLGRFAGLLVASVILVGAGELTAAERFRPFLDGLKDRQFYNSALDYLDEVDRDSATPAEIREILPYERAQVLLLGAASLLNLDEQRLQLDRAEQELDKFVAASPSHPLAGRANADRANILMDRARVEIWDAADPARESQREDLQEQARRYLTQAKAIISKAVEQHQKEWKTFPVFIGEGDKAQRQARDEAKERYVKSILDAAQIDYLEARTFPDGTVLRKKALDTAIKDYDAISQQFRDDLAGAYALVWKAKCYDESGDPQKALGIFQRVLESDAGDAAFQQLKAFALRFRLVTLNGEKLKDSAVVVDEAQAWLRDHKDQIASDVGIGIQWELSRALEALGNDRNRSETQRRADLSAALEQSRNVNRFPGEHKADASRMVQRLMLALDKKGADVRDFASAYTAASALYDEALRLGDAIRAAESKGNARESADLQRTLRSNGDEMARMFTRALKLRRESTEPEKIAMARLQLAYAYFLQGRYVDAASAGEYQMQMDAAENPQMARNAGNLAISALSAAIDSAGSENAAAEIAWQRELADRLIARWPETNDAQNVKMELAKSAWKSGDWLAAADWWLKVPGGTPQFPAAQTSAGQAYWKRYVQASQLPVAERPDPQQLKDWKNLAVEHLVQGIDQRQKSLPADGGTPDDLVLGKLTLAQIRNLDGQYQKQGNTAGAIELLTAKPHSVIEAVQVPPKTPRPLDSTRAQSEPIASLAYQQLLRSYIGIKDLDKARDARVALEEVAGASNPQALTAIYVEFGRELQQELERLKAAGENDRAEATRRSFEEFLSDLSQRIDGQSFTSMLWIAETLTGLAGDSAGAATTLKKSGEIYSKMLERADEAGFLPNPAVRQDLMLRQTSNLRLQKDFPAAEESLNKLLAARSTAPDVQAEAALLYEQWGLSEGAAGAEKLQIAVTGKNGPPDLWGWNRIVSRLQKESSARGNDVLVRMLADARFRLAESLVALAKLTDDDAARDKLLAQARHTILTFVRSARELSPGDYSRFDGIYRQLLAESGQPEKPMPRDLATLAAEMPATKPLATGGEKATAVTKAATVAARPRSKTPVALIATLVSVGLLAAAGIIFLWVRQASQKKERLREFNRRMAGTNSLR